MARCNFYLNIDEPLSLVLIWFYDIQSKNVLFLLKATETKTAEVFCDDKISAPNWKTESSRTEQQQLGELTL